MISRHPATNYVIAISNMADTGHYENPNFFGFTSICKCNTTFHIDFWMRNSLPTLYWPLVITWTLIWYIFTARCYTECGIAMTSWPSVRPFVTFGYSDQIGLNTSKIISPLTSLWSSLCANTNIMDLLQSEHPQILAGIGVGYRKGDSRRTKSAISLKRQLKSESYC